MPGIGEEIAVPVEISPPTRGLMEGLDSALPDDKYPPVFSPDIENIRVAGGEWSTRLGMTLWKAIGGSGDVRLLDNFYKSDGTRIRVAARGTGAAAIFYTYIEGTDVAFQSQSGSGGGSLGGTTEPRFQGVTLGDKYYFTDRAGVFRKYDSAPADGGNKVRAVGQPAAAVAAPRVRSITFAILEDWSDIVSGWTPSDGTKLELVDDSASNPPPGGGICAHLHPIANTLNQTVTKTISSPLLVPSHTIAFYYQQDRNVARTAIQLGVTGPTDYTDQPAPPIADEWYPKFIKIGDIGQISFLRFLNFKTADTSLRMGPWLLPGNLEGAYRWIYTHYDPTTGRESPPSPVSNNGDAVDLSTVGTTDDATTIKAFQKAVALDFTSDSGTDASTTKIRIYRNGGVASLTKDDFGRDVYFRVAEIFDQSTTINHGGGYASGVTSFVVTSATNINIGDVLILDKGTVGTEEYVTVSNVAGTTITVKTKTLSAHANAATVQIAFIDNVANETIDTTVSLDIERGNPPQGGKFVAKSPDGRLWIFGYTGKPTGVAVSNRPTPDRSTDYEVFPDGVDPLTRRSLTQGWTFEISGDVNDEEIVWGGFYQGYATVLTKRNLYRVYAHSQLEWGPMAIVKLANVGCIAGDTVREVNGILHWVTDGPRVMKWGTNATMSMFGVGPPESISHLRCNVRLNQAPTAYWKNWFALSHTKQNGHYYELYFTPSGQTANTQRLDFNVEQDAWEPVVHYQADGVTPYTWAAAVVRDAYSDVRELYQVDTSGNVYQAEVGLLDNGNPIMVRFASKKIQLGGYTSRLHSVFTRMPEDADTILLKVTADGSEYGPTTHVYTLTLVTAAAVGDVDVMQRLHQDLKGRWAQLTWSGPVDFEPMIRSAVLWFQPIRQGRVSQLNV